MEEALKSLSMSFASIADSLHQIVNDGLNIEITMNEFDQDRIMDTLDNIVGAISDIAEVPLFNIKPTSDDAIPLGLYMGWGSELNVRAQLSNDETSLGTVLPIVVHNDNGDEE